MNNFEKVANYLREEYMFIQAMDSDLEVIEEDKHINYAFPDDTEVMYDSKTGTLIINDFSVTIETVGGLRMYHDKLCGSTLV